MRHPKMRLTLALLASVLFGASSVSGGAPPSVRLMRPDSLIGWDHGTPPPQGWTIVDGRLAGTGNSTPLLSAWTFTDFQLKFQWSVAEGGDWKILLPEVPSGKGLELTLREGDHCGQLADGDGELSPGGRVKFRKGKMHTTLIRREKGKLAFTVDGKWLYEVAVRPDRRFGLGLAVAGDSAALENMRLQEPPGEPMFNGTDLSGWWTKGDITKWRVKRGQVVRLQRAGDYLRTEKQYANFTWSVDVKMQRRGNSGLGIRTPPDGWPTADGMELQLLDRPYDAVVRDEPFMAIYGHVPPLGRADKSEQWNRVVVKADGWMISAWVNGELVQQVNTFHHPELKHRQLTGWLGVQDHGAWTRLRNVRIREAPDGLGLDAWYQPRPRLGVTAILDRLLNPERLSVDDGIASGAAFKTFSGDEKAEHVLAELTGPGAVVRIARSNDEGRLAFYFDGESKPRLECTPGQLHQTLPLVGKDSNPMLTCLTYRKALRVVLLDAARADYRLDYVTLPGDLPVETFVEGKSGFPRGWLDAAKTHLRWFGGGEFHEQDGLPRFGGERETIEPGQTKQLAAVEGAGIVKSLKLLADKRVLDNNDLWMYVTVDGEQRPALSAPVRYLFPALERNYDNYVLADQGGPTNMLAMPFGNGITVAVSNRGGRPIHGVGTLLSVQPATDKTRDDILGRMRLRGVFQQARKGQDELINQEGAGRWVGFVYQVPQGDPTGIASLLVDGRPLDGWSAASLDALLGGSGDFRKHLSGRKGVLCWRYLMLAPVGFRESLVLTDGGNRVGERLTLFYLKK